MRTFIAIDLPPAIQQQLMTSQQVLRHRLDVADIGRAVRWTPVENMHVTLRFLGETSAAQRAELHAALSVISASQSRFVLRLNDLGCFPNFRRPAVVWFGIGGDLAALNGLQAQIETAVCAAGFQPDKRAYSPHLTIGRVRRNVKRHIPREVGAMIQRFDKPIPDTSFSVDHITHILSVLEPGGAVYTSLAQFRF
jgi:2'-5' RNA ligase